MKEEIVKCPRCKKKAEVIKPVYTIKQVLKINYCYCKRCDYEFDSLEEK